jgi:hypothetical protein
MEMLFGLEWRKMYEEQMVPNFMGLFQAFITETPLKERQKHDFLPGLSAVERDLQSACEHFHVLSPGERTK